MFDLALSVPALLIAFVITVTEMTEVVALVFALSADAASIRSGALGAIAGTAVVSLVALASGAAIEALPHGDLLWAATVVLAAFGVFLFRSTLKSYRRARHPGPAGPPTHHALRFAGGFSVGAIETTEAVIVLLALAAGGAGSSAVIGALAGGGILVVAAALVHERIRRIKVPTLKLGGTAMLFSFAVFWAGEADSYAWPGSDLILIPLFVIAVVLVRGAVELFLRRDAPVEPKG
jgi:Ca2+/H+ antiporter, TMEM165/GDT1 family